MQRLNIRSAYLFIFVASRDRRPRHKATAMLCRLGKLRIWIQAGREFVQVDALGGPGMLGGAREPLIRSQKKSNQLEALREGVRNFEKLPSRFRPKCRLGLRDRPGHS